LLVLRGTRAVRRHPPRGPPDPLVRLAPAAHDVPQRRLPRRGDPALPRPPRPLRHPAGDDRRGRRSFAIRTPIWHLASEGVVFVLFGVMISSAAFIVANCYGVINLIGLLAMASFVGVCLALVAQALPGAAADALGGGAAPFIVAAVARRRRHVSDF